MTKRTSTSDNGFTLIEVLVCLVLIGVMGAIAVMGFAAMAKGYVFARENTQMSLKAQVTLAKIAREIESNHIATYTLKSADDTAVSYTRDDPSVVHTIALAGAEIRLDGITLVNSLDSLVFNYYDCCNAKLETPVIAANLLRIRRVDICLRLRGADGIVSEMTNTVKVQEAYY
ncbi:MAG: prepilin-type N-terminal cleavage/methylation domain-containing protein [Syntrophaceae bacterium]|nr:prepilin-type N-terminal cleavage/methylation domain-containing protein [Syntrophaceae bacterium]